MPPSTNSGSNPPAQSESRANISNRSVRPKARVPEMESTEPPVGFRELRDSASAQPSRPPSKRSKVTLVACQPCQHRKHKVSRTQPDPVRDVELTHLRDDQCDGARPVCSQCRARKRPDCTYDAAGDQRRTSALKQRILELERQTRDLQDVVVGIGSATDKDAAIAIARQLADNGFQRTAEVAQALRMDETLKDTFANSQRSQAMLRSAEYGEAADDTLVNASPSSAETVDSLDLEGVVDPNLQYWPIDTAEADAQLGQAKYDNTLMQVRIPRPARTIFLEQSTKGESRRPHRLMDQSQSSLGQSLA